MERTEEEIRERVEEIREILESGVTQVSVDGTTTSYNLVALRSQMRYLESQLPENRAKRPRASRIRLDGC